MKKRTRRLLIVENRCKRGHAPIRIVKGKRKLRTCYQCHKLRKRWEKLVDRCHNPKNPHYPDYGARGIRVCRKWRNSFSKWYEDFGHLLDGNMELTIDRINNNRGYCPGNVRLVTTKEQNRNQRRSVHITYDGVTKNQEDWCRQYGLHSGTVSGRLKRGWDIERALFGVHTELVANNKIIIHYGGLSLTFSQWCARLGFSKRTVENRIYKSGWTYAQALGFCPKDGEYQKPRIVKFVPMHGSMFE